MAIIRGALAACWWLARFTIWTALAMVGFAHLLERLSALL